MPHLRDSIVKGKKQYRCAMCNEHILVGEKHVVRVGVWDDFGQFRMHLECEFVTRDWSQDDWDAHEPGEFIRPSKEILIVQSEPLPLTILSIQPEVKS